MRRLLSRLGVLSLVCAAALALVVIGGAIGRAGSDSTRPTAADAATPPAADRLSATITRAQQRLRGVPGDWRTWAELSSAYLERSRTSADPTFYPKAEGAARKSLELRAEGNSDALVALGALANARHDFAAARTHALAAVTVNSYDADAYGVLADAYTQLGDAPAATEAVQRMLDLRPGLPAYARASYDLELRGKVGEATDLMRRALDAAVDPADTAFCHHQLGDLAWHSGDLASAEREYAAALAADPSSVSGRRGQARAAAAAGRTDAALTGYAALTASSPTPSDLLEYAELLGAAGRDADAAGQLKLAEAAHKLFIDNGGVDGLTTAALAIAGNRPAEAVDAARAEWSRRRHVDVADALGWALYRAGRPDEALPLAQRAVASGARSAGYAYHLGMIELALGRRAEARTNLSRAIEINPHFSPLDVPAARRALQELR